MFLRLLFACLVRAVVRKTDFKAGLKIQQFNRNKIQRFFPPVSKAVNTLGWFVKSAEAEGGVLLHQTLAYDCRSAKRFHVRRRRGAWNAALTGGFNHRFLNNHFTL